MWKSEGMGKTDRWAVIVGLALGASMLVSGPSVLACCAQAECEYNHCCYAPNTCMQVGGEGETRICVVQWIEPGGFFHCGAGSWCNGELCDEL